MSRQWEVRPASFPWVQGPAVPFFQCLALEAWLGDLGPSFALKGYVGGPRARESPAVGGTWFYRGLHIRTGTAAVRPPLSRCERRCSQEQMVEWVILSGCPWGP